MVFLNFLNFFLFFWNFLFPVGKERNRAIIFIFSLSQPFPTYFGLEWSHNGIFQFFEFFSIFLEFSLARREETKQSDNFYFLSFSAFSNIFWLGMKSQWYFSISWIFLEFSLTHREGTKQNDSFYFLTFSVFSNIFWLGMKP